MKVIASLLGIIQVAILVLAFGSGLLVLLAYGIGWVVNLLMGLEPFQATVLGLAGIFVFLILADRVFHALMPLSPPVNDYEFDDVDDVDEDENESDDYEIIEDEEELEKLYPGIPRWRRPIKNLDFSKVNANDRCPCGSGRKYKNCHGAKQTKV